MKHFVSLAFSLSLATFTISASKLSAEQTVESASHQPSLSFLDSIETGCGWFRYNIQAKSRELILGFPHSCSGGIVAWSPDGEKGVAYFSKRFVGFSSYTAPGIEKASWNQPAFENIDPHIYQINLREKKLLRLSLPPDAKNIESIGFDSENHIIALLLKEIPNSDIHGDSFLFEGKKIKNTAVVGIPAVAIAIRWDETRNSWSRTEIAATDTGACDTRGVGVLEISNKLGPSSSELLSSPPDGEQIKDKSLLEKLGTYGQGQWIRLQGTDVLVWEISADFAFLTGRLAYLKQNEPGKPFSLPGLDTTSGDIMTPMLNKPYLLLANSDGSHPRLFDLRTYTLVFSSDSAKASTFWP